MSDVLAIFGPTDLDSALIGELERLHPTRVTVLLEGVDSGWSEDDGPTSEALRERMAALLALIVRRTGAAVTGLAGDRDQLEGWRFDREVSGRMPAWVCRERSPAQRTGGSLPVRMSVPPAPDDIVTTHAEGAANGREPLLVLEPLRAFLDAHGLEAPATLDASPIGDGHSNVTLALSTGVVLRRPPRGPLPPSAHDVLREARLLRALETTDVRAPRVLAECEDPAIIGAPFYVMERVAGEVITTSLPAALDSEAQCGRIAAELVDALVELHAADWSALALGGFGRPSGYLERQLHRFAGLWEHNKTREVPEVAQVRRWLADHLPTSDPARPATIVHGDYRLGNVMFAPGAPARLVAIFDWEMATIGDPLADVGYMLSHWRHGGDPPTRFSLQTVTEHAGFPDRAGVVELYARRSGRPVEDLNWYVVLAIWKSVVFMEGNYRRAVSGATDDPYLKSFGAGVPELARRALEITRDGL